ncbi:MAG TPA: surface-adhesin E family protein [Allosphingosinicella sp.]|nr:surface-adhesin E family protein [Allosphingosinicella sp.]
MLELALAFAMAQEVAPCEASGAPVAGCPQWRSVARRPDGEALLDPASVRRERDGFTIALRTVFARPQQGVTHLVARVRFDCARRTSSLLHIDMFSAEGRKVHELDPASEVRPATAGSPYAAVLAEFCPR